MKKPKSKANKYGKSVSMTQGKGKASSKKAFANRDTGGNSGKHGMKRTSGMDGRHYTARNNSGK